MKIIIYNKNNPCWLKIITNTLKKVLFSDEKNTQLFHNTSCSGINIDLRCNCHDFDHNWPRYWMIHFGHYSRISALIPSP